MSTNTATFTRIECGECGGPMGSAVSAYAICYDCAHTVELSDLLPNMEEGESLAFDSLGMLGYTSV